MTTCNLVATANDVATYASGFMNEVTEARRKALRLLRHGGTMTRRGQGFVVTAVTALALAFGCAGKVLTQGQVVVQVDSDLGIPDEWHTLLMHMAVRGETRLDERYDVGATKLEIPAPLDLVQGSFF